MFTTLPPEILDKILEQIPAKGGRLTLVACALVATWWTEPSQRRLFSSVLIHEGNYERWMKGTVLSGSKAYLLKFVRSMWHSRSRRGGIKYQLQDLARDSGEYLSTLRNLQSLTLVNIRVEHISEDLFRTCFSAFRETLTYLFLDFFTASFSAFVTLVEYFPNLASLRLGSYTAEPDGGPVPSLSRPLRGKLHIDEVLATHLEFFNRFATLDLEYEELVIDTSLTVFVETNFVESALQICTNTVRVLRLIAQLPRG